jgi:hypothetical protein
MSHFIAGAIATAAVAATAVAPTLTRNAPAHPSAANVQRLAEAGEEAAMPSSYCQTVRRKRDRIERKAARMSVKFQQDHGIEDAVSGFGGRLFLPVILSLKSTGEIDMSSYIRLRRSYRQAYKSSLRRDCQLRFLRKLDPVLEYVAEA